MQGQGGECVPAPTLLDWTDSHTYLLSVASVDQTLPMCPDYARIDEKPALYADPVWSNQCEVCTCQSPVGSCALSTQLEAYYTHPAVCPAPAATPFEPFDAPNPWDGTCTPMSPVQGKAIQSLMIPPLVVTDPPTCDPGVPMAADPPQWAKHARVCAWERSPDCQASDALCAPRVPPSAAGLIFMQCLGMRKPVPPNPGAGMVKCPDEWPNEYDLYERDGYIDSRQCEPCTCGAPTGSKCSTSVSVYTTTSDCTGAHDTELVDSTAASCHDVPLGSALLSKMADTPEYQPGSCPAMGGEVIDGGVVGDETLAWMFCCR